ncbi:MAG: type I-C CRISPR-associated endonuclease Cas1 [Oscillospiraceae bacterium]|nr:type I-C CRISPR-associated endonuclease Cas1 [Oscillospiraceae bacterium]
MRKLLNTLFVTLEDAYAALDGENVVVRQGERIAGRFPLHILESIYLFSYAGASPALMGKCADMGIDLVFLSPRGRFYARTCGASRGNVLLRRTQYRIADDPVQSCRISRNFIFGKLANARAVLNRTRRDHPLRIDRETFEQASLQLRGLMEQALAETSPEALRGLEGAGATVYFRLFDEMILQNKETFFFRGRSRRPPMDPVNALLSFVYTMLGTDCASALETVGLDAYVGFLHRDRPGRTSLAQDLMEELRPCIADRFVLTLINDRVVNAGDFDTQENGAVLLTPDGRRKIQKEWHSRKQGKIVHPFLKEKIEWGLVPYVQALLLARCLRGDLDAYPPFLWK